MNFRKQPQRNFKRVNKIIEIKLKSGRNFFGNPDGLSLSNKSLRSKEKHLFVKRFIVYGC